MSEPLVRHRSLPELLILVLICAGFGTSLVAYSQLFPDNYDYLTADEVALGFVSCALTFWITVQLAGSDDTASPWLTMFDEFRLGTGMNLIFQALLNYLDLLTRSLFLIVVGGASAAVFLGIARCVARLSAALSPAAR